jgi:DNA-binding CsgD family transcriptional regulator
MSTPVRASDRDLRALAAIVSQDRTDLPDGEGLPPSLLADLMGQIRCDALGLDGWDSGRQMCWFSQEIPARDAGGTDFEPWDPVFWEQYWDCQHCSYAARTGDQRSIITVADFYSARQWHSTGMYTDFCHPLGQEHHLMVCLPRALPPTTAPGRYVRLTLLRGPGPDFSERDRAVLTLLGPHLDQAYLDAERRRHPIPRITARQKDLLRLLAAGQTNSQIARHLGISEGTVRTHLENIYDRLGVSSRTAAVTRAFPDRVA